uniref:Rhodanese domain-containing protein n=1 Tax=Heterosigma akashiwo TaxID=2829 RepID=A0A7S3XU18_HETAK
MGAAGSIDSPLKLGYCTAEQIGELIASIGPEYEQYSQMSIKAGVDGEVIEEFDCEGFETFLKKDFGIENTVHRKKMVAQFRKRKDADLRKLSRVAPASIVPVEDAERSALDMGGLDGYVQTEISLSNVLLAKLDFLGDSFDSEGMNNTSRASLRGTSHRITYNKLLGPEDVVLSNITFGPACSRTMRAFQRAGPRQLIHFNPQRVRAAIVTCGGLCPGLNNVIREITLALRNLYGCTEVYGIRGGYNGFFDSTLQPIELTPEVVDNIHLKGGTILGSARGGFDLEKILQFLEQTGVNQLYVCGGDGTHRGAHKIATECLRRNLNVAVAGVPKTIDNDIGLIDRSFGFQTAVEAAQAAIQAAKVEAQCNIPRGIGIVKLMGRSSGFIASHAALASADVDLCLVPEVPLVPDGPQGFLPHLRRRVMEKGHAVVVLAEGAGEDVLGQSAEVDAGGNRKLPAVGDWVKKQIETYFSGQGMPATVKYIDPSYMIRSVPANSTDSLYCTLLSQNAVHGAMAGYTAFSVGLVNNRMVWIPMPILTDNSPRVMAPHGRTWERVLSATHQPNTVPPDAKIDKMVTTRTVM